MGSSTSLGLIGKEKNKTRPKVRRPERTKGLSLVERRKERNATSPSGADPFRPKALPFQKRVGEVLLRGRQKSSHFAFLLCRPSEGSKRSEQETIDPRKAIGLEEQDNSGLVNINENRFFH